MPVVGNVSLPIADREREWDGQSAAAAVAEHCNNEPECMADAFLWQDPEADETTQDAYSLGFADVIDDELYIVPAGVAATAGGHGVDATDLSDEDKDRVKTKICALYEVLQEAFEDWPECPFAEAEDEGEDEENITGSLALVSSGSGLFNVEGTLIVEGEASGDGRMVEKGAIEWDDTPIPIIWDRAEGDHTGMTVGAITEIKRSNGNIKGKGYLSESEDTETKEAVSRIAELFNEQAVGVSVSLDKLDVELRIKTDALMDDSEPEGNENGEHVERFSYDDALEVCLRGRLRHVAVVDTPAFPEAKLSIVAGAYYPPKEWFKDPKFANDGENDFRLSLQEADRPEEGVAWGCPLTITDSGQVYGHAALWERCHVGYSGTCTKPPKEPSSFSGYLVGSAVEGVPTGPLVIGTGHADLNAGAGRAQAHYDNTGTAVADVTVGSDSHGLWVAGAVRTTATDDDVAVLRSSALSGDWRPIGGKLKLVALLAVNSPGFRTNRSPYAIAASGAIVAVGPVCADCGQQHPDYGSFSDRLRTVEGALADLLAKV